MKNVAIRLSELGTFSNLWYIVANPNWFKNNQIAEYLCRDGCIRTRTIQVETEHSIEAVLADSRSGYFISSDEAAKCCQQHGYDYDIE